MDQVKIGKFVAELRKQKGWTQAQLGEMLGVTNKTVSRWENGNYMPELAIIPSLAEVLGVSVNELMAGDRFAEEEYKREADAQLLKTMQLIEKIREIRETRWLSRGLSLTVLAILIAGFFNLNVLKNLNEHLLDGYYEMSTHLVLLAILIIAVALGGIIYLNKGRFLLFIGAVLLFESFILDTVMFFVLLSIFLPLLYFSSTLDHMYFQAIDELLENTEKPENLRKEAKQEERGSD